MIYDITMIQSYCHRSIIFSVITFAITFFSITGNHYSQAKTGKLRGVVIDSTSGQHLSYCNVLIEDLNTGASTEGNGHFFISAIPGDKEYNLLVSYVGYITKRLKVFIENNKITEIEIHLVPTSIEIQTVEKIGSVPIEKNETDLGKEIISVKNLETLPKGVETDIFRSLQFLPGVSSTGDISARYYVRGGANNQNLVLIDGVPIYNPFHALGMFSVVDPEMINSAEFYKSAFPTEYGGRISSVMKINTKEGNKNRFGGSASGSFLTAKSALYGPIPDGSFMLTGRKSYSNQVLKNFLNDKNIPIDFYDFSFKVNYSNPNFIDDSKFILHGFFSGDNIKNDSPYKEDIKWSNKILGFKRFQVYDVPLYSEFDLYMSHFTGEVDPKLSGGKPLKNEITDLSLRFDFTYIYDSNDELGVGLSITSIKSKIFYIHRNGLFSDNSDFAANISIYGRYKYIRNKNFGLDIGSRVNLEGFKSAGNFFFEPRLNITWLPFKWIRIKTSAGRYQQGLTTINDENEVISLFEPWYLIPEYMKPARATHFSGGFDLQLWKPLTFSVEGYYKLMEHLPTINPDKIYDTDPDLIEGSGKSYGWEFLLRFMEEPFSISTAYTLGWTYKTVDGWKYQPKYDIRNNLSILAEYNLGKGWKVSMQWFYNTGIPFTPSLGYYDKFFFDELYSYFDQYEGYTPYLLLGDINSKRLPDYHRMDISLSKRIEIWGLKIYADVSVLNVYDRANLFYLDRETGERVNMLPFLTTATLKLEI